MAVSGLIGGQSEDTVERMLLDSSQFQKGLQDCAKLIRQQQRHEKDLELVRSELEKRTQSLVDTNTRMGDAVEKVGRKFAVAELAARGMEGAIRAAWQSIGDLTRRGLEWEEDVKGNEVGIERMKDAMGGLADSLVVAGEREKMMKSGLQATEEQLDAVAKAAVVYSRQMNVDVDQALGTITERLVGGKGIPRLMRELGIEFTTTGDKAGDAIKAMGEMESKFGSMAVTAENNKERVKQAAATWRDFKGALGAWLIDAMDVKEALEAINGLMHPPKPMQTTWTYNEDLLSRAMGDTFSMTASPLEQLKDPYGYRRRHTAWIPKYDDNAQKAGRSGPAQQYNDWEMYQRRLKAEREEYEKTERYKTRVQEAELEQRKRDLEAAYAEEGRLQDRARNELDERREQTRSRDREKSRLGGMTSFLLGEDGLRGLDAAAAKMDKLYGSMEPATQLMRDLNDAARDFSNTLRDLGTGTLVQAYGGILNIADAAIQGKGNLGEMVLELGKSTALGLSQTLLAQGLAASIQASAYAAVPFTWPLAAAYSAQAGIFYTGAATLGAIGLGLSAAQAGVSGGGSRSGAAPAVASGESYRPSYGKSESNRTIEIVVNNYMGGRDDLGAIPYTQTRTKKLLAA
jgi:hypothetical protein